MKTVLNRLAVLVSILLFVGCASTGVNFDEHKMTDIKKGETTKAELVQMFGAPQNRTVNSEGIVMLTWTYAEASVKGESFIPFAGAFVGGGKTKGKTLSVRLQNDKVTDYTFSGGGSESRNMTQAAPKK